MKHVKNAAAIIGVFIAVNSILALIFDRTTPIGAFYETLWYQKILGLRARPNVYDPFADGSKFTIFMDSDMSNINSDFASAKETIGGAIFIASKLNTANPHQPSGIVAFSDTLPYAEYVSTLMLNIVEPIDFSNIPDGVPITLRSTDIGKFNTLDDFCYSHFTYEPEELCFRVE